MDPGTKDDQVNSGIVYYFGDRSQDYRSLMSSGADILTDEIAVKQANCVIVEQTHSALIHIATESDRGSGIGTKPQIPHCDGMATNRHDVFLLIRTADCPPVLFYDPIKLVVSAVHSGREGTRRNICAAAVDTMKSEWQCDPVNIHAMIGIGICADHNQVSEDIFVQFIKSVTSMGLDTTRCFDRHIDIRNIIYQQIKQCGISENNIITDDSCTYEDTRYFSYRRSGSMNHQINIIGICNG